MFTTPKKGSGPDTDDAPPALPKSSSKSIRSKALTMLKLGDKILPAESHQPREPSIKVREMSMRLPSTREMSMKNFSTMLHLKAPAKNHQQPEAPTSSAAPPIGEPSDADSPPPSPPSTEIPRVPSAAPLAISHSAYEVLIQDMTKLRVQLRKASEELESERLNTYALTQRLEEYKQKEARGAQLKSGQGLEREVARLDEELSMERAITRSAEARVAQLEDAMERATQEAEARVQALEKQLNEVKSRKVVLPTTLPDKQDSELKRLLAVKTKECDDLQRANQSLSERLASTSSEFAATMQQAVEEVAKLELHVAETESRLAEAQATIRSLKPVAQASERLAQKAQQQQVEAARQQQQQQQQQQQEAIRKQQQAQEAVKQEAVKQEAAAAAAAAAEQAARLAERRTSEIQREQAIAAAKKLLAMKKITQKEYDNVVLAAEAAFKTCAA